MTKAVVLLSSGLDSSVNLYKAYREYDKLFSITFDYGQKSAQKEIERSQKMARDLNINHEVIELPWLRAITKTALVSGKMEVPKGSEVSINNYERSLQTASAVWVPNRNGVFLNIAASFAESLGANHIIPGFNKEEASTFPDNSVEYIDAATQALSFSTQNQVRVKCFTQNLNKTEIVKMGQELEVNFDLIWSCYYSGEEMCGECESCQRYFRAIREAG